MAQARPCGRKGIHERRRKERQDYGMRQSRGVARMTRIAVLIMSVAINAMSVPALASECMSDRDLAARLATIRNLPAGPVSDDKACRSYAGSFYDLVIARQAAAICAHGDNRERNLSLTRRSTPSTTRSPTVAVASASQFGSRCSNDRQAGVQGAAHTRVSQPRWNTDDASRQRMVRISFRNQARHGHH